MTACRQLKASEGQGCPDQHPEYGSLPVESPSLPGFPIDANTCRNPACDNFGVSEAHIENPKHGYTHSETNGLLKYKCKRCNQSRAVYSNVSVLEAFHRCLQISFPYASCPNPDGKNHYFNLFEHYHEDLRDERQKLYRVNVQDKAVSEIKICRLSGSNGLTLVRHMLDYCPGKCRCIRGSAQITHTLAWVGQCRHNSPA